MAPITIHGNTVNPDPAADGTPSQFTSRDAENTNYIYVQGTGPLNDDQKIQMRDLDAHILQYEGDDTYLCRYPPHSLQPLRELPFVRHANAYHKVFKTSAHLKNALRHRNRAPISIALHQGARNGADVATEVRNMPGVQSDSVHAHGLHITAEVTPEALSHLEQLDDVRHIEFTPPDTLMNNLGRNLLHGDQVQSSKAPGGTLYGGSGQLVTVADTGFDNGKTDAENIHPAFKSCPSVQLVAVGRPDQTDDPNGHGTHVAGSVLGSGLSTELGGSSSTSTSNGKPAISVQGTATGANLLLQSLLTSDKKLKTGSPPETIANLFQPAYDAPHNSRIHTNSWGRTWTWDTTARGPYPYYGEAIDTFVNTNQSMVLVFAAGNDHGKKSDDGTVPTAQIGSQAAAKNCITVGASQSSRRYDGWKYDANAAPIADKDTFAMASFSSVGPTMEKRIKPDIVGPGTAILSAKSRNSLDSDTWNPKYVGVSGDPLWGFLSGTSMSTPLVAGCVAVIRQALLSAKLSNLGSASSPTAALIKALLIHYATDMSGMHQVATWDDNAQKTIMTTVEYGPMPDFNCGYGRVNVDAVLLAVQQRKGFTAGEAYQGFEDSKPALKSGEKCFIDIALPPKSAGLSASPILKATMAYSDKFGADIQNFLRLSVQSVGINPAQTKFGNEGHAVENNVQQVVWKSYGGTSATICIEAVRIKDIGDSQTFAVVWSWF